MIIEHFCVGGDKMDFAKEYWEEFEKLSIDLLKSYFEDIDETKISVKRTQSQKDGGYDGIVIISDTTNNVAYKILSESKLRAISSKDLPMSDFSKTLVIAINMAAHELYIFTNLHFSQETQTRIAKFSNMTSSITPVPLYTDFIICFRCSGV